MDNKKAETPIKSPKERKATSPFKSLRKMSLPKYNPKQPRKEGEEQKDFRFTITREDVETAFNFFDVNGKKKLTPKDLKKRLSAFYPHMSNREYKLLISEPDFTVDKLWKIIDNNIVTNFDPVKEAFKVYDPHDNGYIDEQQLRRIMQRLGYGNITQEDINVLFKTADVDGDGKISLEGLDLLDLLENLHF